MDHHERGNGTVQQHMGGGLGGGMAIVYNTRRNDFEGEGAMVVYGHLHTQNFSHTHS